MPRYYTPQEKITALAQLEENNGLIALTSLQTGIPERTLRDWRRDWLRSLPPSPPPTPRRWRQSEDIPHFEDEMDALNFMRRQIVDQLVRLSVELSKDSTITTPYQRVLALSQLMDKLLKLDLHLKPYKMSEVEKAIMPGWEDEEPDSPD